MLTRLARSSFHHRRAVVGIWVLALVIAVVGGSALAGDYATSGRLPNTDSQAAYDPLHRTSPQRHGDEAQIVFADVTQEPPGDRRLPGRGRQREGRHRRRADPGLARRQVADRADHDRGRIGHAPEADRETT